MKRIADLDPAKLTDAQREVYDAIASGPRKGVRGPLAVWLHNPALAQHAQSLGKYCRYDTSLEPRLSELAIITIARVWSSEYEWYAHKRFALEAGVSPEIVEAIRTGAQPVFTKDDEAVVHAFITELHRDRVVSDATYAQAVALLGQTGVIDLTGIAGYYTLISMTINVFGVTPPDGVANELTA